MIFAVTVKIPELPVVSEMQGAFSYFGLIYPSNRFAFNHQVTKAMKSNPPSQVRTTFTKAFA
jgi:hypothetical protein